MTMRTILTRHGYGVLKKGKTDAELDAIVRELTVSPKNGFQMSNANNDDDTFCVCMETKKYLYVPKHYGLQKFGLPEESKLKEGRYVDHMEFKGELLSHQTTPVKEYLERAMDLKHMGGILQLPPGSGKTVMALYILCQLGVKTIIIVHKDFLLNQWRERIEQYIPNAKVGILKQKLVEVDDCDITIASLQSLSMKTYDEGTFDEFGFVIIDECHHIAAQVFSRALLKVNFRYALGLSATVQRKDGLSKVFKWFIGDVVHKVTTRNMAITCRVDVCTYMDPKDDKYKQEVYLYNGKVNLAKMLNNVTEHKPRQEYVVEKLLAVLRRDPNRSVIMLSDRRRHLEETKELIAKREPSLANETGLYIGGMKNAALEETKTKKIILGTYNMISEGFDLPRLDTLFLMTSKSDVEQSVGRIQRKHEYGENDYEPLVVDIVDNFSVFENQARKRRQFYNKKNYAITDCCDAPQQTNVQCG